MKLFFVLFLNLFFSTITPWKETDPRSERLLGPPARLSSQSQNIPPPIHSETELKAFVAKMSTSMEQRIQPSAMDLSRKILQQYQDDPHSIAMIASSANGLWVLGLKEPSVYLMTQAILRRPNSDHTNNLAAYLTMSGAPHMAIPMLDFLNEVHPGNSTVFNNLAHAWLDLGNEDKAEKYLDSAIQVYPYHPQANYTKALFHEARGDMLAANQAVRRSLKHSVTRTKLQKLYQLEEGKKLNPMDFNSKKPYFATTYNPKDYLDKLPSVYATTAGKEVDRMWQAFYDQMNEELRRLDEAIASNREKAEKDLEELGLKNKNSLYPTLSPYYIKSLALQGKYMDLDDYVRIMREDGDAATAYIMEWAELKNKFEKERNDALKDIEENAPSGSDLLFNNCPVIFPLVNKNIEEINILNRKYRETSLKRWMGNAFRKYNTLMDAAPTESIALQGILELKREIVSKLLTLRHESYDLPDCVNEEELEVGRGSGGPLRDFDEVTCATVSTLYVPFTGQITIRCNTMEVVFNPALIPVNGSFTSTYYGNREVITEASIGISVEGVDLNGSSKFDQEGNFTGGNVSLGTSVKGVGVSVNGEFDSEGFTKGSVELGIENELGLLPQSIAEAAPLELGMKGEAAVGVELGPEGIEDWYVKESTELEVGASAEADIGEHGKEAIEYANEIAKVASGGKSDGIPEPKVSTGASVSADNRWSVNTGYTVERSTSFSWLEN